MYMCVCVSYDCDHRRQKLVILIIIQCIHFNTLGQKRQLSHVGSLQSYQE